MEKHQVELPEDERKLLAAGASQKNRPAFPSDYTYGDYDFTGAPIIVHRTSVGLTKREYFAAMALASGSSPSASVQKADALIEALNK